MSGESYWASGEWNVACWRCGFKYKSSGLRKTWQGFWACGKCWEPRQPQDFVKGVADNPGVPWSQEQNWNFVGPAALLCSIPGRSAFPGYMTPGCSIPDTSFYPG